MAYRKTTWKDNLPPYLEDDRLNNIEKGVEANDIALTDLVVEVDESYDQVQDNTDQIAQNEQDIYTIISGETLQGYFTPIETLEYPTVHEVGFSWYIAGLPDEGYLYTTGDLNGMTANNMDKVIETVNGYDLIQIADDGALTNGALGNINKPIFSLPLQSNVEPDIGNGTATFTRASTATYIDRYGVLQTAGIDEPRFEKEGYLTEGSSTNVCLYSEDPLNAHWLKVSMTAVVADATLAPDGISTCVKGTFGSANARISNPIENITDDIVTGFLYVKQPDTNAVTNCTISISERTTFKISRILFEFSTETMSVQTTNPELHTILYGFERHINGWYKLWLKVDMTGFPYTGLNLQLENRIGSNYEKDILLWAGQMESRLFRTSYIKTDDLPVTREKDYLSYDGFNNAPMTNTADPQMTIIVDFDSPAIVMDENAPIILQFNPSVEESGWWTIKRNKNNTKMVTQTGRDGASTHSVSKGLEDELSMRRFGSVFNGLNLQCYDGGELAGSHTVMTSTPMTNSMYGIEIRVGWTEAGDEISQFGHISNLRVYDLALSSAEMKIS